MKKINLSKLKPTNFESKKKLDKKEEAKPAEVKQTEASSLDALSSYGRAGINLSFKGKSKQEITDEEKKKDALKHFTKKQLFCSPEPLFNDEDIEEIIKDEEIYQRVITLAGITCTNIVSQEEGLFGKKNIMDIASDKEKYKRAIALSNFTYTDFQNKKQLLFCEEDIIQLSKDEETYQRTLELLDITIKGSNGKERRALDKYAIIPIARNKNKSIQEIKNKINDIINITYPDSKGNMQRVFSDFYVGYIAQDENIEIDDGFKTRASKLATIKYIDEYGRETRLFDENDIKEMANNKNLFVGDDFAKKINHLLNATYTDFYGSEYKIFEKDTIKDIIRNDKAYERILELMKFSSPDADGKEEPIFRNGGYLFEIAHEEEKYRKALNLLNFTFVNSNGQEEKIFNDDYCLYEITKNEETYERALKLLSISHTNQNGEEEKTFKKARHIVEIARDKEKYEKALALLDIHYTDSLGKECKLFSNEYDIQKIVQNDLSIDNEFEKRAIALSKKTVSNIEGKEYPLFNCDEIVKLSKDKEACERALKLADITYTNTKGRKLKMFDGRIISEMAQNPNLIVDNNFKQRLSSLEDVTCIDKYGQKQKLFNLYNIGRLACEEEVYKRAMYLAGLTHKNSDNTDASIFNSELIILDIAKDEDTFKRALELMQITYTDSDGDKKNIFRDEKIIQEISKDEQTYKRTMDILKITNTDSSGKEVKIFKNQHYIANIVKDEKKYNNALALMNIFYIDSNNQKQRVFDDEYDIQRTSGANLTIDQDFKRRAVALAQITYTDSKNIQNRVFSQIDIGKIAQAETKFKNAVKVANLTFTDKEGEKQKVLKSFDGIVEILDNDDLFNSMIDYINNALKNNIPISNNIIGSVVFEETNKEQIKKLTEIYGREKVEGFSRYDLNCLCNALPLYKVQDINEISMADKKMLVKKLVSLNAGIFELNLLYKKDFPLIPSSQEEYCALLPQIVKSLGIEVKPVSDEKINEFHTDMSHLSLGLKELSDEEFNNLKITQDYSREEFISDTIEVLGDLKDCEKQKVFDYFGFELKENENNETGYTITGYPANLNNGEKLSHIKDEKTKKIIENLRPIVVKFSEENKIKCDNPKVEEELNKIVEVLPEIRTMIGKNQHGTHSFDVLKHSLKVIQKIAQNPKFDELSEGDKRIILLSGLLHDITKGEGYVDKTHANESAFDTCYIAKKLKLSRNDEIKLYTLSKNHEWLQYVNKKDLSNEEIKKREKEVAFNLQQEDLFKMAEIFTGADLKAVKDNDKFYDIFKDKFIKRSENIKEYIAQLKATQPILPTTKLPKASEIKKHITQINPDGSTNIKGVYQGEDGLIVIRYNEVENWEELGLPKGTVSSGIKIPDTDINTGNIKFIAHGLDYSNQLSKFSALGLPDSDALLSVSYMERPESKFRMFRSQGVLLDVDSNYIYGGGETDSGSGCGKSIEDFIQNYAYEGAGRHGDRKFISNLIKRTLNLNDEEYLKFIQENKNKSFNEIEPKETKEKLIQAFATINSRTRNGGREYNEMYASNPKVMGVFAYPTNKDNEIGNTMDFVHYQKDFLKDYAKENDVPMVIFGE